MKVHPTGLEGVLVLEPKIFSEARGSFFESYNARTFREATGVDAVFVQDNQSRSARHVLRGIHYQLVRPQGKLVRVLAGRVLDVAVDLRRSSSQFGRWVAVELSADNALQLWVPPGFGHAYLVLSDVADLAYKTTDFWWSEHERAIVWNDPAIGVQWPLAGEPILSPKDAGAAKLADAEVYA
jgi:dTDP-4-dehydrorhamnose 3,5-epimerase